MKPAKSETLKNLKYDLPAGLVVFLVALPLCLGIALASNAPLFSGLVTGIVAGVLVGVLSGSHLSVSGPAAGLTVIVSTAIAHLGSFELFLCAVVLAGVFQLAFGLFRAGFLGSLVPNSVIQGMLVAIGLTIVFKQLPHLVGGNTHAAGAGALAQSHGLLVDVYRSLLTLNPTALFIGTSSMALLFVSNAAAKRKTPFLSLIPGPLLVVAFGILANELMRFTLPAHALSGGHLVQLPQISGIEGIREVLIYPNFSGLKSQAVWMVALTIALIGSLETLLSLEATEKMDPLRRRASSDRELVAQGAGNMVAGLLGGLPMTSVIVRSSANVFSGARTRASAVYHGVFLLLSVLFLPRLLNLIPLASLAAILVSVGFKLSHPKVFLGFYKQGTSQFLPFTFTVGAVLATNLLEGVVFGLVVALLGALRKYQSKAYEWNVAGERTTLQVEKNLTFLSKSSLKQAFSKVANTSQFSVKIRQGVSVDHDILEILSDFESSRREKESSKTTAFTGREPVYRKSESL